MLGIETIIYSRIKAHLTSKFKTKYPDISFTTSDRVQSTPKFPNVYVQLVGSPEVGNDLENNTILGVEATFQIETTDNNSQNRAKDVMDEVVKVMKSMRFTVMVMPEFQNTNSAYRCVTRFRRVVGSLDKL